MFELCLAEKQQSLKLRCWLGSLSNTRKPPKRSILRYHPHLQGLDEIAAAKQGESKRRQTNKKP